VVRQRLVSTGELAKELHVTRTTIQRWWNEGIIAPDAVTAGGHGRWDVKRVQRELLRRQMDRD
jgi:DNA-binding transcriptional MerR regulator